jgi:predicted Zn-dependent protease
VAPGLDLVPLGDIDRRVVEGVGRRLARHGFDPRVVEGGPSVDALVAPGTTRLQALMVLPALERARADHVLALTDLALTDGAKPWIYGMGEMNGRAAVFSTAPFRRGGLTQEVFLDRLSAAVLHELAHNVGMVHCRTRGCLMHATHEPAALRQLDLSFCGPCERTWRRRIRAGPSPAVGAPVTGSIASARGSRGTP